MRKNTSIFLILFIILGFATNSPAVPLDLSSWDTWGPVSFSSDGSSATLYEDEIGGPISLENWALFIPNDAVSFSFQYSLTLAPSNEDYFDFYFNDVLSPLFSLGYNNISGTADVISGSYSVSLAGLQGNTLPVIFSLQWGFDDFGFDSFLTISDVEITTGSVNPVPESATILMFLTGLVGLMGFRKLCL